MSALSQIGTPPKCTADFCLIPIGTPTASVSAEIAEVQRLLKQSGVKYSMHSAGTTLGKWQRACISGILLTETTIEGSWDDVMKVMGQCHSMLHARGVVRVQTDIRVGSRTDKSQTMEDKVAAVERLLAGDK